MTNRNDNPTKMTCRIGEVWCDDFVGRECDWRYAHRTDTHVRPFGKDGFAEILTEHLVIDTWCDNQVVFAEALSGIFVGNIAKVALTMPGERSCRITAEMDIATGTFECSKRFVG